MKNYRNKYFYTLVELLMAMAIFAIISVIMMRFFSSAQQIWSKASQKNVMYADARVALDIMTAELQGALYDNKIGVVADPDQVPGIYPFWFEYKSLGDNSFFNPGYSYPYPWLSLATLAEKTAFQQAVYNKAYVTQLNFISATPFKPNVNASDICKIKYIYLPVRLDNATNYNPTGMWYINSAYPATALNPNPYPVKGGTLIRSCTGNLTSAGVNNYPTLYNFLSLPYDPAIAPTRVFDIFNNTNSENYSQIIDGIIDVKITCYVLAWDSGTSSYILKSYNPMDKNGNVTYAADSTFTNEEITSNIGTIVSGSPFPVAIKIDLYMLAEHDLREWLDALRNKAGEVDLNKYLDGNIGRANLIKNERMRCFSKTIYMSGSR